MIPAWFSSREQRRERFARARLAGALALARLLGQPNLPILLPLAEALRQAYLARAAADACAARATHPPGPNPAH